MNPVLSSIWNYLVDQQPDLLIKALMLTVGLSIAAALAYQGISRLRAWDPTATLTGLILVANIASMGVGAGFVITKLGPQTQIPQGYIPHHFGPFRHMRTASHIAPMTNQVFTLADVNHDGFLSADEARTAAETFIQTYGDQSSASNGLNAAQFREAMRQQFRPQEPRGPEPPAAPPRSEPGPVASPSLESRAIKPIG